MCVLALAWQAHPRWRLVVAGNRDELHARPAAPLARWDGEPELIAGRDLLSGGTWMGVSEAGRFGVVTNLRGYGPPAPDKASRGALVTDWLRGETGEAAPEAYNPFNLILADGAQATFRTNRPEALRSALAPGLYGLSNGALDEPWPKTMRLKSLLLDWLMGPADAPERMLDALREETVPAMGLPAGAPSDVPEEPHLSAIFIRNPVYGTRCSTVVAIDRDGEGVILERRYDAGSEPAGEDRIGFRWPA